MNRLLGPIAAVVAFITLVVGLTSMHDSGASAPPPQDWGAVMASEWAGFAEVAEREQAEAVWIWTAAVNDANAKAWYDYHAWKAVERWVQTVRQNEARAARRTVVRPVVQATRSASSYEASSGRCGGNLPPCSVMECESGGNIRAENPSSSASGKWQIIDSTWGGYGGYSRASHAPEHVQDARAAEIYNGGAGRGNWVC